MDLVNEPGVPTLNTVAIHYHEWFSSLMRAGFSESQAIYLVGQSLAACEMVAAMRRHA